VCLFTVILMFLGRLGARRQIDWRLDTRASRLFAQTVFGAYRLPPGGVINNLFIQLGVDAVEEKLLRLAEILIDRKVLYPARLLGTYYVMALDGTGIRCYTKRHCPHCLTKTVNGQTFYYHNLLQLSIVTPEGLVIPLMTEFIENPEIPPGASEEKIKQDCELKAFYRLAPRLAQRFPRLPIALAMDALYAVGPVFEICARYGWKFFIGHSDKQLTYVMQEFLALTAIELDNTLWRTAGKDGAIHQVFSWANGIEYEDSDKKLHTLNVLQCREAKPGKDDITKFRWLTPFEITQDNTAILANNGARLRWKTENEVFFVQKICGFALEHAYTLDDNAAKIFHILLQFAFILFQLIEKGSLFRNAFPKGLGSDKNLAAGLLEAFRRIHLTAETFETILAERIQIRFEHRPPKTTLAGQLYIPTPAMDSS
jgi:hypothetical protein